MPWYRQLWPWILIAIPAAAVVASAITLWLALSHPEHLVVKDDEYQQIRGELHAQEPATKQNGEESSSQDDG